MVKQWALVVCVYKNKNKWEWDTNELKRTCAEGRESNISKISLGLLISKLYFSGWKFVSDLFIYKDVCLLMTRN